jgi:hypothetical protein
MPSVAFVIHMSVNMLNVIMVSVAMLNNVMLSVIIPRALLLSVIIPSRYVNCRYANSHGVISIRTIIHD